MGLPPRLQATLPSGGQEAVTPVIGAILILVITVLGIGAVLAWGAPMIERIQTQNAQTAMVGEFEDLRDSSRALSVPDHSRFPTVVLSRGQVSLQPGSRIMVTADHDTSNTGCDFHITDWADTTSKTTVSVSTAGCRSANLQISSVSGATLSQVYFAPSSASATVATADFTKGDWLFRLTNNANPPTVVYAEAWLHSSDDVAWSTDSSTGRREVTLDSGAIFSQAAGTVYLEKSSVIGDATFGASYYGLWLRTLTAASYNTITGAGSHQVYLSLLGNYDRVDNANVYRLRYDIAGPLAQSWCNGLVNRDNSIASQLALYTSQGASCAQVTTDGVRSVCFEHVAALSGANACTTAPSAAFTFRFLHARIYTSLAV